MALSREQFQELRNKGLSVDQIIKFESGEQPSQTPQFGKEEPKTFFGKARDFAASIVGGGKLAEGLGGAIASGGVANTLSEETAQTQELQKKILARIKEKEAAGEDTSQLRTAFRNSQSLASSLSSGQTAFTDTLPTGKEVTGSALRLGGTLAGGFISQQAAKTFALGGANTFLSGALRGAGAGVAAGGVEGAIQGAGVGLEQDRNASGVAISAGIGALGGAAIGGTLGAIGGGIAGKLRGANDPNKVLDYATPKTSDLSPTQYKKALSRGLITPKTATQPAQYNLPEKQKEIVFKYKDLFSADPVESTKNVATKVGELDDEVGSFLRQNNGIFSKGELRNALKNSMDEISDITIDEQRLGEAKDKLINNFVTSLESNDNESLWLARKEFDSSIESAFKGSPTLQKEVKIALRNAVQDFLAERTPNETYRSLMSDMSNLIQVRDNALALKAVKERSLSGFENWLKENPTLAKVMGWGGAAAIAGGALNWIFGGRSDSSSGG